MSDEDKTLWDGGASPEPPESADDRPVGPDLAGAALGALSMSEDAAIRVAAEHDPSVAAELAALQMVAAEMACVLPIQQINRGRSAGIRSRLISRAAATRDGRRARSEPAVPRPLSAPPLGSGAVSGAPLGPSGTPAAQARPVEREPKREPKRKIKRDFNWLAMAAGLAFVLTGAGLIRVVRDRDDILDAVAAQRASLAKQMASLQASVAAKDSLITSLTGPNMQVVDLVNYASQDPLARMFWDQKTQEWTMYAYNLRQPKPGEVFQIWLITSATPQPVSVGTFTPDAHGAAVLHVRYPLGRRQLERVVVSEEPAGGVPSPTGSIIIAGAGR